MKRAILPVLICAAALVSAQSVPDLSGVWVVSGSVNLPGDPAYRPEALKLWQERKANLAKDDPAAFCLPNGVVRVTALPYKIVQTAKLVVLLSEGNTHSFRRFFLDGRPHNLDLEPNSWTGDSIGKWEGNTLVVDTIGFNDRSWLDDTGKPHSEEMHVIERYRRPDAGHLQVEYTIEDPRFLARSYSFTRTFVPAQREIQERFCTEQNRLAGK
ncbi:MAG TPA: hypothetical protein VGJ09_13295 [Bryobacteraceae bacterium]